MGSADPGQRQGPFGDSDGRRYELGGRFVRHPATNGGETEANRSRKTPNGVDGQSATGKSRQSRFPTGGLDAAHFLE